MNKLKGRDFLTLLDYSREDLEAILNLAFDLKMKLASGEPTPLLAGKNLGMLFCSPSTRTRASFETAMSQLGGHAQYFGIETIQGHLSENWVDTAQVFSRYLNGLVVRLARLPAPFPTLKYGECRQTLELMADNASIPLVNALDDEEHPCQTMADIMTIMEKLGSDFKKKKIAVPWVQYDHWVSPGMAHSTALAGATLGMHLTFAYPPGFDLDSKYMDEAKRRAEQSGATIEITSSLDEACEDADVILATYWGSVSNKDEDAKLREPFASWCINERHFDIAAKNAIFMNCMPLRRGMQATAEVVDGPMSVIYDEAENRLHTEKAILSLIMG